MEKESRNYRNSPINYCLLNGVLTLTSNVSGGITVTSNSLNGGTISGSASKCTGINSTSLSLSGYTAGSSIIRWESCTFSDFSSNVTTISNTTTNYTATNLSATQYYRAVLSNGGCTFQSSIATVTITPNTSISTQPSTLAQSVCQNSTPTSLSVVASGGSLTYQWYSNGSNSNSGGTSIGGATNSSYSPSTASVGTTYYYVIVSGSCGSSVTSNVSGAVAVTDLTATLTISSGSTINCGSSSTLSIALTGTSPWDVSYSDGTTTTNVYDQSSSPYTFSVSPKTTTTYSITQLTDYNYCTSTPKTSKFNGYITLRR
jgi:hypothetical protein